MRWRLYELEGEHGRVNIHWRGPFFGLGTPTWVKVVSNPNDCVDGLGVDSNGL
jgi:hypothetical protein